MAFEKAVNKRRSADQTRQKREIPIMTEEMTRITRSSEKVEERKAETRLR
jgi:hypothetical protein